MQILVDEADRAVLELGWSIHRFGRDLFYACRRVGGRTQYLHRTLLGEPSGEVDHRNGDGLDNRRDNLRLAPHRLNLANARPQLGRSSRFKGVSLYRKAGDWEAYITVAGRKRHLGRFTDETDAARAYNAAATAAWGEFARLNPI